MAERECGHLMAPLDALSDQHERVNSHLLDMWWSEALLASEPFASQVRLIIFATSVMLVVLRN